MGEVLALQEDAGAAARCRQPCRLVNRRGTSCIVLQQPAELGVEAGVVSRFEIGTAKLVDRLDERLGHETSAELAEVSPGIGIPPPYGPRHQGHVVLSLLEARVSIRG